MCSLCFLLIFHLLILYIWLLPNNLLRLITIKNNILIINQMFCSLFLSLQISIPDMIFFLKLSYLDTHFTQWIHTVIFFCRFEIVVLFSVSSLIVNFLYFPPQSIHSLTGHILNFVLRFILFCTLSWVISSTNLVYGRARSLLHK